jgi:DNA-binding winged helix-turn-helix (wHTH) protein
MRSLQTIRFDGWVLHPDVGELIRGEEKIRLQDQPLQVLKELLERPGELVTREQLIARLWPKGVVDYDTGINSAVRKLRVALQDTGDTPRYIETVPRKGYRFMAGSMQKSRPRRKRPPRSRRHRHCAAAPRVPRHSYFMCWVSAGGSVRRVSVLAQARRQPRTPSRP